MDDREPFKEIQARLAATLSVLIQELAQTRAFVQALLVTQGQILVLLGRSEQQVKSDFEQIIANSVNQEIAHVTESVLGAFERILERSERKQNQDPT